MHHYVFILIYMYIYTYFYTSIYMYCIFPARNPSFLGLFNVLCQEPEAGFEGSYVGKQTAAKGVISMLEALLRRRWRAGGWWVEPPKTWLETAKIRRTCIQNTDLK